MEERILVYKDPEFDNWANRYRWMQKELQKLADGLKTLGIEPTDELIKRLYRGESLEGMTAEKHVGDALKGLPATLLRTISDLYKKERSDEYNNAVGNQADKIVEWRRRNDASSMIDFNYYHVEDGTITIDPRHTEYLESMFCVFIDSDNRKAVYDKWLQLQKAKADFETAVKSASKRKGYSRLEEERGITGNDLLAVATPGQFCLVKIRYDGEMMLNGENFSHIL